MQSEKISGLGLVNPRSNHILAALQPKEYDRWSPFFEVVDLPVGEVLYESGAVVTHIYFPLTAIISLLNLLEDGGSSESAVIGNEGLTGFSLYMGGGSTPGMAVVRSAGACVRLRASVFQEQFDLAGTVLHSVLLFTQALVTQTAQTAACNRHHSLDQRLCRSLLLSLDRLTGVKLDITQEIIAHMLGVRREGVTEAASNLQKAALISYSRGHITVRNRNGLEARACECYAVVKKEYERLLPKRAQATGHYLRSDV